MESRLKKLFSDTFLFAISNFGSKILIFLMLPLYTSVLSLEEYSTADIIANAVSLLVPILTLSICDATLRFTLSKNENPHVVLTNSLLLVGTATAFLLLVTPLVKVFAESFFRYWQYLFVTVVVTAMQHCLANYIKGIGKTKQFAIQGILYTVVLIACNLVFLLALEIGLEGYLLAIILANLSSVIFMCIAVKLWKDFRVLKLDKTVLKDMLIYSIPMLFTTIAWWVNSSLDKYMILAFVGLSANGLYAVAHKIPSIFSTLTALFSQAWRITAISEYEDGDTDSSVKFYSSVYSKYAVLCVYACAGITVFSQFLASFLFQSEYYVAWQLVPPLMLAALFEAYSGFLASIYSAFKKTKFLSISTGIGVIINLILNYFLIRQLGVIGAPIATFLSFIAVWIARTIVLKRIVSIVIDYKKLVFTLLVLIFGGLYYAFDCPYKAAIYILCICIMIMVNLKETKEMLFVAIKFAKRRKVLKRK